MSLLDDNTFLFEYLQNYIEQTKVLFHHNDIECVTKIDKRVGYFCLVYCFEDPKGLLFDISEKFTICPLGRVVL